MPASFSYRVKGQETCVLYASTTKATTGISASLFTVRCISSCEEVFCPFSFNEAYSAKLYVCEAVVASLIQGTIMIDDSNELILASVVLGVCVGACLILGIVPLA